MRPFQFINGPWENSELPTIVRENSAGGDPHILATIQRVHNPDALYELCRIANDMIEYKASGDLVEFARGLLEEATAANRTGNDPAVAIAAGVRAALAAAKTGGA